MRKKKKLHRPWINKDIELIWMTSSPMTGETSEVVVRGINVAGAEAEAEEDMKMTQVIQVVTVARVDVC